MFSPSDNNNNDSKSSGSGFKGVPGNDSAPAASPEVAKSVTPNIPSLNNNANTGIAPQNQGADNNALPAQPKEDKNHKVLKLNNQLLNLKILTMKLLNQLMKLHNKNQINNKIQHNKNLKKLKLLKNELRKNHL